MEKTENYTKIGGWLLLPALGLIVQPISFIFNCILPVFYNHLSFRVIIDYTILNADFFLLLMVAVVSWFFFNRKRNAEAIYIIYILVMVLLWEILDGVHESHSDPPVIAMIFYSMVIVPYFVLSQRVKGTFSVELNKDVFIEKLFFPLSSFLTKFYSSLAKSRYFIFLIMFLFVFAGIILNCALRSLRIDGDLLHTFDYL